ncbi:hypothetical protein BJ508DRAFT_413735 [Ascobolus immersus RN42]|uniref:Uncharacterized protein n=1 Tax=Ascobolus immersus RN42 TaxID=1160509 RepID=A0A3N4IG11_ASCIM|nr:hypothetical protein BJ508DRAFT_413735 [Ascobolus immersus RN42]
MSPSVDELQQKLDDHSKSLASLQKLLLGCEATLDNFRSLLRQEEDRRLSLSVQIAREQDKIVACKKVLENVKNGVDLETTYEESRKARDGKWMEEEQERAKRWDEEERQQMKRWEEREKERTRRWKEEDIKRRQVLESELQDKYATLEARKRAAMQEIQAEKERLKKLTEAREEEWRRRQREVPQKVVQKGDQQKTPQTQSLKRPAPVSEPTRRPKRRAAEAKDYRIPGDLADTEDSSSHRVSPTSTRRRASGPARAIVEEEPETENANEENEGEDDDDDDDGANKSDASSAYGEPISTRGRGTGRGRARGRGGNWRGRGGKAVAAPAPVPTRGRGAVRKTSARGGRTRGRLTRKADLQRESAQETSDDEVLFLSERKLDTPTKTPSETPRRSPVKTPSQSVTTMSGSDGQRAAAETEETGATSAGGTPTKAELMAMATPAPTAPTVSGTTPQKRFSATEELLGHVKKMKQEDTSENGGDTKNGSSSWYGI